jgi:hypothetical protein
VEQVERAQEAEKEEGDDAEEGAAEVVEQSEGDKTCSRLHDIRLRICTISPMPEAVHKRLECGAEADERRLEMLPAQKSVPRYSARVLAAMVLTPA